MMLIEASSADIWPNEQNRESDRIINQMVYNLVDSPSGETPASKKILVYTGLRDGMKPGQQSFLDQKCPVSDCVLTADHTQMSSADVVLWQNHVNKPYHARPLGQIWMVTEFYLSYTKHNTQYLLSLQWRLISVTGIHARVALSYTWSIQPQQSGQLDRHI